MTCSSSLHYLIISVSDISHPLALEPVYLDQFSFQQDRQIRNCPIESDCACADADDRSQTIILVPLKDQETPTRDQK